MYLHFTFPTPSNLVNMEKFLYEIIPLLHIKAAVKCCVYLLKPNIWPEKVNTKNTIKKSTHGNGCTQSHYRVAKYVKRWKIGPLLGQQCDYTDQTFKNLSLWNRSIKNYKQFTIVNEKATVTCCTQTNDPRKSSCTTIIYVSLSGKNTSNSFALFSALCSATYWYTCNPQLRSLR